MNLNAFIQRAAATHPILTEEEEQQLTRAYLTNRDPKLLDKIVKHNLRLVLLVASKYQLDDDIISEGYIGLLAAIEKYNPDTAKFSTYAVYWIRAMIMRYLMRNCRLVKVGTTAAQRKLYYQLKREKDKLKSQGREVSAEALAEILGVSPEEIVDMEIRLKSEIRLNAAVSEEIEEEQINFLQSDGPTPEEALVEEQEKQRFKEKLVEFTSSLNERERVVFEKRMYEDQTLQEAGTIAGVTRERIRQIQQRVSEKFKRFCIKNKFSQTFI